MPLAALDRTAPGAISSLSTMNAGDTNPTSVLPGFLPMKVVVLALILVIVL